MDIEGLMQALTAEEKAALVSGTDFMYTNPIPRLGIPSLRMSDGPHGLRVQKEGGDNGVSESEPATSFPTAVTTATSWNPENTRKMGEAIAEECRYYGVHTLLGPGVNIKRNPLCGRNFEYFSEDPYLAGVMGAAEVMGVQSKGVGVSVKHFALNNSENFRFMGNSVASENTMRKLYLKPFEYIVKHAHPATIMCAYNQINGTFCSENKWLLTDVLRKEWGFEGLAMTYVHNLDERSFTRTLWQMCTECIVVFPDGVNVLPWMLCGTNEIGVATAEKMATARLVIWAQHGIYGAGRDLDETFGLIETAEKAAEIYMKIAHLPLINTITDEQMHLLEARFGVKAREGYLD